MAPPVPLSDGTVYVADEHFSGKPGLGDGDYPGFPADACPEELPDLSNHFSLLAELLKGEPDLYHKFKDRQTSLGIGLAKCIKTGIDNRGHQLIKTVGLVAGDEECYETFKELFRSMIVLLHGPGCFSVPYVSDFDLNHLSTMHLDPSGKHVLSTQIRLARNLRGIRFPPAVTLEERRKVERVIVKALMELEGPLKGEYHPLAESSSFAPKPKGMGQGDQRVLRQANLIFDRPDSTASLCSGVGRHWPDGRGVFVNESRSFSVWVNEEEHFRALVARQGDDVQGAFCEMAHALDSINASLRRHGECPDGFAFSEELGFLTSCPASIGTSMRVGVIVNLPSIQSTDQQADLIAWCADRRLSVRSAVDERGVQLKGVFELANSDRLYPSEVQVINLLVESISELIQAELYPPTNRPLDNVAENPSAEEETPNDDLDWQLARAETCTQMAVRIQAVHRGKKARQEAQRRRSSCVLPAASSLDVAVKAQGSLEAVALLEPRQDPAFAEMQFTEHQVRLNTRALLTNAMESGQLASTLNTLRSAALMDPASPAPPAVAPPRPAAPSPPATTSTITTRSPAPSPPTTTITTRPAAPPATTSTSTTRPPAPSPAAPSPPPRAPAATPPPPPASSSRAADSPVHAVMLLEAIKQRDRRIGSLTLRVRQLQRLLTERDEHSTRLQEDVHQVRVNSEQLGAALMNQAQGLQDEDGRCSKLLQGRQKLLNDLDEEASQQRQHMLDLGQESFSARSESPPAYTVPNMVAGRSEVSTACTMRDIATPTPPAMLMASKVGEKIKEYA